MGSSPVRLVFFSWIILDSQDNTFEKGKKTKESMTMNGTKRKTNSEPFCLPSILWPKKLNT